MPEHNALRKQLEDRLTRLLHRVGRIEGDLRQTHDRDWTERATELENDDVLEGLDEIGLTLKSGARITEYENSHRPSATLYAPVDAKYSAQKP